MECTIEGEHIDRYGRRWLHVSWRKAVYADLGKNAPLYCIKRGWQKETDQIKVWVSPEDNIYVLDSTSPRLSEEIRRSVRMRLDEIRASQDE